MKFPANKKAITLIGMSGAGKSFIGRNLAEQLNFQFIDPDKVLEEKAGQIVQDIIDEQGEKKFLEIENKTIIGLGNIQNKIISPGGSVIYSLPAMEYLSANSIIIYLSDSCDKIFNRIKNLESRGIVGLKNKKFGQLCKERGKLYKKFANITIDMSKMQTDDKDLKTKEVIEKIITGINKL
ncbi:shikimate kinase [Patescibacteria group bacterium]